MDSWLQSIMGLYEAHGVLRESLEVLLIIFGVLGAFAVRRRKRALTPTTFLLLSGSVLIDASVRFLTDPATGRKLEYAASVLFLLGVIRLLIEGVDAVTHRGKVHRSTIGRELLMIVLWFAVAIFLLYSDFGVQLGSILQSVSIIAAGLAFGLQEFLGNIFSGVTLQMGHPFEPGDWVRSGPHVGRVKGIAWRATTIVTRANERLEIPNSVIAKEVLFNYATGAVRDEITVGISYGVPPNHVREVVLTVLRDVPQIMHTHPPEVLAWEYGDFAIQYHIRYWIADYGEQEKVRDRVTSSLWYALRRHSIEIPFPIRTLHVHDASRAESDHADAGFERELMNDLRQVDWLSGLNDEELRMLVPSVDVRQFGAGEMLLRQGEQGESMFIFRSGTAEFFAQTPDGQNRHLGNYVRGDFTGEMALMTGAPRTASVRAITDVEVIEMDREGFTSLFKEHPDVAAAIGDIIAARSQQLLEKMSAGDSANGKSSPRRWLLAKMRELFDITEQP